MGVPVCVRLCVHACESVEDCAILMSVACGCVYIHMRMCMCMSAFMFKRMYPKSCECKVVHMRVYLHILLAHGHSCRMLQARHWLPWEDA